MGTYYKNMVLVNAVLSNDIYLTTMNKTGMMSLVRKNVTEDVLRATVQHMHKESERNGRAIFSWGAQDDTHTLAYIPNDVRDEFLAWCEEVGYKRNE